MFCIYCNKESEGNFCITCGHKMISSEKEWERWKTRYSEYDKQKLKEIILHKDEYMGDAYVAAEYLYSNIPEEEKEDDIQKNDKQAIWYWGINGERKGPVTLEELVQMYVNEKIASDTYVWRPGFQDWSRLDQAGIMLPVKQNNSPPPLSIKNISNGSLIFLLFVPILSTIIQYIIAGVFDMDANRLWWVACTLNTSCCIVDLYKLKKAGYQTGKLILGVLFLIPLYIYKRMKMVSGKKWLATTSMMIWIVVCIIDLWIPNMFWMKVIGISNPSVINSLQTVSFLNYPDVEVGELFDKTIDHCKWDTYMGADREVLVRVTGELEGDQLETIFKMKMDNSFEILSMRLGGNQCSTEEINGMLAYLYESYRQ